MEHEQVAGDVVRQALGLTADAVEVLKANDRTVVSRVVAGGTSLVVKVYLGGEGRIREAAALADTDLLLGTSVAPDAVVLRDLGAQFALSDVLLHLDRDSAATGIADWARAVGAVHVRTAGSRDRFVDELARQADAVGRETPAASALDAGFATAAQNLAVQGPRAGTQLSAAAVDELIGLEQHFGGGADARALTPSDACPDNNIVTTDGLVLLDFEGASWRHIAWDAAYLTVPWPSCWCSWLMPQHVADAAMDAFREASLPYARTDAFEADVRLATNGWRILSTAWFLEAAVDGDPPSDVVQVPPRRAMVQHRLARLEDERLPHLTDFAAQLLASTRELWGDVPLELAPAFR